MISPNDIPEVLRNFPEHLKLIQSPYKDCKSNTRALSNYIAQKYPSCLKFNINRASYKFGRGLERCTLLMYAVFKCDMKFVNAILSLPNILINKRSGRGYTALHLAVMQSKTEIVHRLLRVPGIDVNIGDNIRRSSEATPSYCSGFPLLTAVYRNNLSIVLALLQVPGINVNQQNEAGETAFSRAFANLTADNLTADNKIAKQKQKDIVILLRSCEGIIRKGKFVDAHGSFAVVYYDDDESYEADHDSVVRTNYRMNHTTVLGRKSDYDLVQGPELLKAVAMNDMPQIVALLQNPKIDINYALANEPFYDITDPNLRREFSEPTRNFIAQWFHHFSVATPGDTALWRAIIGENVIVVRLLLEHPHIDVNFVHGPSGKSLLTHAVETMDKDIIMLLLNRPEIDLFPLEYYHDRHYLTDCECCDPRTHFYPCGRECGSCDRILENEAIQELFTNAYKRQGLYEKREILLEAKILLEANLKRQGAKMRRWPSAGFIPTFLETASQREKLVTVRRLIRSDNRYKRHGGVDDPEDEDTKTIWLIAQTIHRIWMCSRDKNGDSLFHILCELPTHPTLRSLILESRIPINTLNGSGKSPLVIAAEHDREETVLLLLSMNGIEVPRDYKFPENRSGYRIRKHLVVQNEIKTIKYIELFSSLPRLNEDILGCIVPFLLPVS